MVIIPASASLGLLHSESVPADQNQALPPKHAANPLRRTRRNDRCGIERKRATPPERGYALINAFPSFLRAMF